MGLIGKPRTWEEHKQLTMSDKEKLKEYIGRFSLLFNIDKSLLEFDTLDKLYGIIVEYQHKYLPTDDPRENQLVDLVTEIECAIDHAKHRDENNPHLKTGTAIDVMCKGGLKRGEFVGIYVMDDFAFFGKSALTAENISRTAKLVADETFKMLDKLEKTKKYGVTDKDILNSHSYIPMFYSCYPPNVIEIRGNKVCFYHGLEEGLMCWDCMDKRKFKKKLAKARK